MKFWPCAFHHALRMHGTLPTCDDPITSPVTKATNIVKDFTHFRTFRCHAWVCPPGKRAAKFKPKSRWGAFLKRVPCKTHNVLCHDPETSHVKIATHACFDEGFNDLPTANVPPNVIHLQQTDDKNPTPVDSHDIDTSMPKFCVIQFAHLDHFTMNIPGAKHHHFGLWCVDDESLHHTCIKDVSINSDASCIASLLKASWRCIRGAFVTTHDRTIHCTICNGEKMHMLRQQVDDFFHSLRP